MNKRHFLKTLAGAVAGFTILPGRDNLRSPVGSQIQSVVAKSDVEYFPV